MKVLLDHCVPKDFGKLLVGHEVVHTSAIRWGHLSNGKLLRAAEEASFDAFVTVDRKMLVEQEIEHRRFAALFLRAPRNSLPVLALMASQALEALEQLGPGEVKVVIHPNWKT